MSDGFLGGLLAGFLVGLLTSPAIRAWLVWREIELMRREGELEDALLDRLDTVPVSGPGGRIDARPH